MPVWDWNIWPGATDIRQLTLHEMFTCYERGWHYRGILADLEGEELNFVRELANKIGSWVSGDV
jgi:hypothetical protein